MAAPATSPSARPLQHVGEAPLQASNLGSPIPDASGMQGNTSLLPPPPPPPPTAPSFPGDSDRITPANITIVRTAVELQRACLSGAVDIEGICSDPDPVAALNMTEEDLVGMLPLKPYQCVLIFRDTLLMVNNGNLWVDNLYLRISTRQRSPRMSFIDVKMAVWGNNVTAGEIFVTRVTFQPNGRGTAIGIAAEIGMVSLFVHECVFTDWSGFRSPFVINYQSVFHIRDTILRNMYIEAEIADVSFEGIVHFQNVSLANVTLQQGAVVSTTLNDYQLSIGYSLTYYADDDAAYDVPLEVVPPGERSMWGENFLLSNSTMSDCVYLIAPLDMVYPGCPQESAKGRARIQARGVSLGTPVSATGPYDNAEAYRPTSYQLDNYIYPDYSDYFIYFDYMYMHMYPEPAGGPWAQGYPEDWDYIYELANDPRLWSAARFLDVGSPWLVKMRKVRTN